MRSSHNLTRPMSKGPGGDRRHRAQGVSALKIWPARRPGLHEAVAAGPAHHVPLATDRVDRRVSWPSVGGRSPIPTMGSSSMMARFERSTSRVDSAPRQGAIELFATMDGLIAALASLASQPEQLDSPKTQRQLGDRVREALLKNLKETPAAPTGLRTIEHLGGPHEGRAVRALQRRCLTRSRRGGSPSRPRLGDKVAPRFDRHAAARVPASVQASGTAALETCFART
jgi:hypothetical protein